MERDDRKITFSFRVRLAIVMAALLLLTLATVQYLNQEAQRRVREELVRQKAVVDNTVDRQFEYVIKATNFALTSIWENDYIYNLIDQKYPNALNRDRIRHVLIVQEDGTIYDSTEKAMVGSTVELPKTDQPESAMLGGITQKGDPVAHLVGHAGAGGPSDTYWFRIKTRQEGEGSAYFWIAVVVSTEHVSTAILESQQQIAAVIESTAETRLRATLGVFALAVALMILLVWRFTRPIQQLSEAAGRVARGDLDFEVGINRRDEMGQLADTFNDMIGGLKAKTELEERLNNAERAAVIGRLTSAIAHEIRNPLNFINLSIDRVRSKFPPVEADDRRQFDGLLGTIKEEVGRLNRLVTDVLHFGRPANLHVRRFDLAEILRGILEIATTQAYEQDVTIATNLPHEPVLIEADAEKLKSCFSNIVINAIQAMPDGGSLQVSLESDEQSCWIRFVDSGVGIPEEALDRVFEPYYSTKDTGTGLGLAVTKKIIDEHGGHIRVQSAPGEGTTFEVELPCTREWASADKQLSVVGT